MKPCAWCNKERGIVDPPGTSHGICREHAELLLAEVGLRVKRDPAGVASISSGPAVEHHASALPPAILHTPTNPAAGPIISRAVSGGSTSIREETQSATSPAVCAAGAARDL